MKKVYLTERQIRLALESVTSDFGTDPTPGSIASEVGTASLITGDEGETELSNTVNMDDVSHQLYPQQYGSLNGRRY